MEVRRHHEGHWRIARQRTKALEKAQRLEGFEQPVVRSGRVRIQPAKDSLHLQPAISSVRRVLVATACSVHTAENRRPASLHPSAPVETWRTTEGGPGHAELSRHADVSDFA